MVKSAVHTYRRSKAGIITGRRPFSSHRREEENYVAGAVRTAVSGAKPAGLFEVGPQGLARRMESHGEVIRRDLKRLRHGRRGLAFEIEAPKLFG